MDLKNIQINAVQFYQSHKKWVLFGGGALAVLIIGAFLLLSSNRSEVNAAQVVYMDVISGPITESIDVVGSLEAVPSITLSWESGGIVGPFDLKVGDVVEKEQVLMRLEDSSLASSILQAQTDLLDAQVVLENLTVANTDLYTAAQILADSEYARIDYKADRDYWNYKGSSWDSIDKAREDYYAKEQIRWEKEAVYGTLSNLDADDPVRLAAYDELKTATEESDKYLHYVSNLLGVYYDHAVETDLIQYDQALADVEEARIAYNRYLDQTDEIAAANANVQALQNIINQSKIIAPFSGTVTNISAASGELVSASEAAVRIDNLDYMMVDIYVSEVDINKIEIGQRAVLSFDALPGQEYAGVVESISSAGSSESGVVEFRVSVVVQDADEAVRPGFTTVVSIITNEIENALLIPTQAIQTKNGQPIVMLVEKDGSTTAVSIKLGAVSDIYTQVISDEISDGDQLAVIIKNSTDEGGFNPSEMRKVFQSESGKSSGG